MYMAAQLGGFEEITALPLNGSDAAPFYKFKQLISAVRITARRCVLLTNLPSEKNFYSE
jgi:hypothetical protein